MMSQLYMKEIYFFLNKGNYNRCSKVVPVNRLRENNSGLQTEGNTSTIREENKEATETLKCNKKTKDNETHTEPNY